MKSRLRLCLGKGLERLGCGLLVALAALGAGSPASAADAGASDSRKPGTIRMAERLAKMVKETDPLKNPFLCRERVPLMRAQLEERKGDNAWLFVFGQDLMNSNLNEEALEIFGLIEANLQKSGGEELKSNFANLKIRQSVCWLRIAELQNCLENHNHDSCIAPIAGGGIHLSKEPSKNAARILRELLEKEPEDLRARWLLNIALMTLGEYPEGVPAQWLIPPKAFASDYPLPRFLDMAAGTGLDVNELSGAAVVDDFDNDGLLDVFTSSIGLSDQLRYFRNQGDGTFEDRTIAAGLKGITGGLNAVHADFNNDGWNDLLLLRGGWMEEAGAFPNSLLKNNGDGTFEDVTEAAGMFSLAPTQTAVWFDFDQDGWLDLFVGNESFVAKGQRYPCELYRNNQDGTFTECAREAGVDFIGYVKGVAAGDYNNDGAPDLYLSMQGEANILFRNLGILRKGADGKPVVRFRNVARIARVQEPFHSFPCWFFDYDNDGWEDLLVTGYHINDVGDVCADYLGLSHGAERARLYRNTGANNFVDVTKSMGLDRVIHAMGANFGDLESDGYLDAYFGTGNPMLSTLIPNLMFRNDSGKTFQDVTTAGGFGHLQKGHGVAFADINNDGAQDIYHNLGGAVSGDVFRNALFANPGHTNQWVVFKFEGVKSNRSAIGARVRVDVETPSGVRSIHRTVSSGGSFGGNPLRQEIGLGDAKGIKSVTVRWPGSGETQEFTGLEMKKFYTVRQGEAAARPQAVKPFAFKQPAVGEHHHH